MTRGRRALQPLGEAMEIRFRAPAVLGAALLLLSAQGVRPAPQPQQPSYSYPQGGPPLFTPQPGDGVSYAPGWPYAPQNGAGTASRQGMQGRGGQRAPPGAPHGPMPMQDPGEALHRQPGRRQLQHPLDYPGDYDSPATTTFPRRPGSGRRPQGAGGLAGQAGRQQQQPPYQPPGWPGQPGRLPDDYDDDLHGLGQPAGPQAADGEVIGLRAALSDVLRAKVALINSAVRGGVRAVLWLPGVLLDTLRSITAAEEAAHHGHGGHGRQPTAGHSLGALWSTSTPHPFAMVAH